MKWIKNILPLIIFLALPLTLLLVSYGPAKNKSTLAAIKNMQIPLPNEIFAGEKINFEISEKASDQCQLYLTNSWGNYLIEPEKYFNKWQFNVSDSITLNAGLLDLEIACNGQKVFKKSITIKPHEAKSPLETYMGSKSINADGGIHWGIITAIPMDKYFNTTNEGTPVEFTLHRPNTSIEKHLLETKYGVAYYKIFSGQKVGKTIIGTKSGKSIGKEKELVEMASAPINLQISAEDIYEFADSRQFFKLKSGLIKDSFGNLVADGTHVKIKIKDPDNSVRMLNAFTMDGIAELHIQNPLFEGQVEISAFVDGNVESNVLLLNFKSILKNFDISYNKAKQELIIGPLIGALGQFISDGAEISLLIMPDKIDRTAIIKGGYSRTDLSDLKAGTYTISATFGGINKTVTLKK